MKGTELAEKALGLDDKQFRVKITTNPDIIITLMSLAKHMSHDTFMATAREIGSGMRVVIQGKEISNQAIETMLSSFPVSMHGLDMMMKAYKPGHGVEQSEDGIARKLLESVFGNDEIDMSA